MASRRDSPPSGPGFDPVALAGARGGYAAVVGADGAVYVWDVVMGETLDAWYVDADGGGGAQDGNRDAEREERETTAKNLRVAVASANGAELMVAVAFESGDDVIVETRRVRLFAEETRADARTPRTRSGRGLSRRRSFVATRETGLAPCNTKRNRRAPFASQPSRGFHAHLHIPGLG